MGGIPKFIDNCIQEVIRWGYAKAYVQIDLSKPLHPGIDIVANHRRRWQGFKYENLSKLCYLCGRVGHDEHDCSHIKREEAKILRKENILFGLWMVGFRVPIESSSMK